MSRRRRSSSTWRTYIIKCSNGSLYVGCSTDPLRRFRQHRDGKGAKYFRMVRPVKLAYVSAEGDKEWAHMIERTLKHLSHDSKLLFIKNASKTYLLRVTTP